MVTTPAIVFLLFLAVQYIYCIEVTVTEGTLEGEEVTTVLGETYYSFKGIPYAKPPVGALRFKAPEDPDSWEGTRNATVHRSVCCQLNLLTGDYSGEEDCLYLNVYTSCLSSKEILPVLVYIHGGAFLWGSGDVSSYGPDFLVKDVVVVTINYRLATLGFLSLGTCDVPGNAGLKDQVKAMEWVQQNIASFGGNPEDVTIMGGTAGGASVSYHMISPLSKGLFHRAITMSGSPTCDFDLGFQPARRARVFAETLGFTGQTDAELLEFLQAADSTSLVNMEASAAAVMASELITDIPFKKQPFTAPVIEPECCSNRFITQDPLEALKNGDVNTCDVMFSYNDQEALLLISSYAAALLSQYKRYPEMFVPSKILINSTPTTILKLSDKIINHYFENKTVSVENIGNFINYASNASIVYDIYRFYRKWPQVGSVYSFVFTGYSSRSVYGSQGSAYGLQGNAHFDDTFYIFDAKSMAMTLTTDSTEYKIIQNIVGAIINFVKYGNPSYNQALGIEWPQYNTKNQAYVDLGETLTVGYGADANEVTFWESIFEDAGMEF